MGLLFGKKLSDGNVVSRKKVSDNAINKRDIREIGGKLGFTRTGARHEFQNMLNKAQAGGVTREEIHEGLQKMILDGRVTKDQAHRMANELGIDRKDLARFKDISESQSFQESGGDKTAEKHPEADKKFLKEKLDSSERSTGKVSSLSNGSAASSHPPVADTPATKAKPTSIWNILNSKRS